LSSSKEHPGEDSSSPRDGLARALQVVATMMTKKSTPAIQRWRKMMVATPTKTKKSEITKVMMKACKRRRSNLGFDIDGSRGDDVWGCRVVSGEDCCRDREKLQVRIVLGIKLFLFLNFFLFGRVLFCFSFFRDQEMVVSQNLDAERKREGGERIICF